MRRIMICLALVAAPGILFSADLPQLEMSTYYMVFLYRGPAWTPQHTPETEKVQEAHMANINKMAQDKKLLLAGPFSDNGDLRGIFVLTVASMDEAEALAKSDPAVQAGRLRYEIHPWFAAKNIRVYPTAADVPHP